MKTLTTKQTAFRDAILAGFTPSKAYKKAFDAKAMSPRAVSEEARKLLKDKRITLAITLAVKGTKQPLLLPPVPVAIRMSMEERLEELRCAARLDPLDAFDELNHFKSIREMPEHVRRAIAGFEIDPVSFIVKVKFIDKIAAIMNYSKLAGDIPKEKGPMLPPRRSQFDLTKLTDEEFREHMRLRKKAMVQPTEGVQIKGNGDSDSEGNSSATHSAY